MTIEAENASLVEDLGAAVAAADAGDAMREEAILRDVSEKALELLHVRTAARSRMGRLMWGEAGPPSENITARLNDEIESLIAAGRLRRSEHLGFVGEYSFFADRILLRDYKPNGDLLWRALPMTAEVNASVETGGSITVSRRPTLTRMAAGAILPGSALIPGFALAKKETFDSRQLYFIFDHPDGGAVVEVNPDYGQVVRQVALRINEVAASLRRRRESATAARSEVADTVALLRELVALRDAGALTGPEFEAQKARLLAQSGSESS